MSVDAAPGVTYHSLKVAGDDVAGWVKPPTRGIPNCWHNYFAVDDADATAHKVVAGRPHRGGWTRSTFLGPGC
jgi:uncharacterized protein